MNALGKIIGFMTKVPGYLAIGFIKIYKLLISPLLPNACRYYPTCSEYSAEAIKRFGLFRGSFLALKRILSCNPFGKGGVDPVPPSFSFFKKK